MRRVYSARQLRELCGKLSELPQAVFETLRELKISHKPPTRRNGRGGQLNCRRPCYHETTHGKIATITGRRRPFLNDSLKKINNPALYSRRNYANIVCIRNDENHNKPNCNLNVSTLITRSVCNKPTEVLEIFDENNVDVLCITETWLKENDTVTIAELTSLGHRFIHNPRMGKSGGGVGLLYKPELALLEKCNGFVATSFEHMEYNRDTLAFTNFLESCSLKQHVQKQTHNRGHVLDLIITRASLDIIKSVDVFDPTISDHSLVTCTLDVHKHTRKRTSLTYRKIKNIDVTQFAQDVTGSSFVDIATADTDPDVLADTYNTVLANLLDKHAPLVTKTRTLRPNTSWYTDDLRREKAKRKRLESRWRSTKLTIDRDLYKNQRNKVIGLLRAAKCSYYRDLISDCRGDANRMFKVLDNLLGRKNKTCLPSCGSVDEIAHLFSQFFQSKIHKIRMNCK
ncbi:uncharacterized protein [Asterias amurensis]|uniref:uncharacterized protein n=1 Tax=Asterias amurensis TaxID=7602 RepID=UPI003AB7B2AD